MYQIRVVHMSNCLVRSNKISRFAQGLLIKIELYSLMAIWHCSNLFSYVTTKNIRGVFLHKTSRAIKTGRKSSFQNIQLVIHPSNSLILITHGTYDLQISVAVLPKNNLRLLQVYVASFKKMPYSCARLNKQIDDWCSVWVQNMNTNIFNKNGGSFIQRVPLMARWKSKRFPRIPACFLSKSESSKTHSLV